MSHVYFCREEKRKLVGEVIGEVMGEVCPTLVRYKKREAQNWIWGFCSAMSN